MRIPAPAALLLATALASPSMAGAANESVAPPVYKCAQRGGAIAYQDAPCKGGVLVDIKPEAPDAEAIARLRRAQDAFDRAAARRQADEAMAALRREEADQRLRELQAMSGPSASYPPDTSYAPAYGIYLPYASPPAPRHRVHRRADDHRLPGRIPAIVRRPTPG